MTRPGSGPALYVVSLAVAAALAGCQASADHPLEAAPKGVALTSAARTPSVSPQVSGTINGLIAVSPASARVVWAAGRAGTYVVTTDAGATWRAGVVPGAEKLQFRDVEAVNAHTAYLLSIGTGTDSRIYKTTDGGATWTMQFQNQDPNAFYDCFSFWSARRGLAFSDSVNGRFPVLRTQDGKTWQDIGDNLPKALDGEAGFSSSGTCVATQGESRAWIGTGGAATARILATRDGGNTWAAYATPLRGSPSAGVFTVAFRNRRDGLLGGGDLDPAAPPFDNVARSRDGGKTWKVAGKAPVGTIFGLAYSLDRDDDDGRDEHGHDAGAVVTGPGGTAWSKDEGDTWTAFPGVTGYWAVAFANEHDGWLVGTGGRILKIAF